MALQAVFAFLALAPAEAVAGAATVVGLLPRGGLGEAGQSGCRRFS